jgi:hypothetical protein
MARGRKLESLSDYKLALKKMYGLGERENYKPWLRVQDVQSDGLSSKTQGLKTNREHHTLSQIETQFFFLAEFSDSVIDIREQFPLLPLDLSYKVAQTIGVEHPRVPNGNLNVMTTDFLLTRSSNGKVWYEAFNIKPEDKLRDTRVSEKIDIERVWWQLLGVKFYLFVGSKETMLQSQNIAWITDPVRHGFIFDDFLKKQALSLLYPGTQSQEDICNVFTSKLDVVGTNALNLLKTLISEKIVQVDLNQPLEDMGLINILNIFRPIEEVAHEA